MLEGYFTPSDGIQKKQRLLAVQAALEIAKASAGSTSANARSDKVEDDLDYVAQKVYLLADAIQAALDK